MQSARRVALSGLTALTLTGAALATPAAAQTTTLGASPAGSAAAATPGNGTGNGTGTGNRAVGPRLQRACLRIPNLEQRTDNLITRLDGDANTRGSLAWLSAKAGLARSAHRNQLATVLDNRLAIRTKTREVLSLRKDDLTKFRTWCESQGVDL